MEGGDAGPSTYRVRDRPVFFSKEQKEVMEIYFQEHEGMKAHGGLKNLMAKPKTHDPEKFKSVTPERVAGWFAQRAPSQLQTLAASDERFLCKAVSSMQSLVDLLTGVDEGVRLAKLDSNAMLG